MKKLFLMAVLTLAIVVQAADPVIVIDKTGKEVHPGASNRWPVSHLNAGTAGVKQLLTAPGNTKSHFVTGFIMTGGATADGFHILRQNCLTLDTASSTITMADDGTDFDWAADGDFTAEFWINLEATTAAVPSLMLRGDEDSDGWLIELTSGSVVIFTIHDGTNTAVVTGTTAIDDGAWHHIICQVDRSSSTGMQIYVDASAEQATASDPTGVTSELFGGTTIVMTGVDGEVFYISTVGIYLGSANAALSEATILSRYNSGIGFKYEGDETGLQVGFNTDEGISTACHDIKNDASNVITVTNTTWAPARQNGATVEVNVDGVPINEQDMMRAVGKFWTGLGAAFGGVFIDFPHPIKIGRNSPLSILETDGGFDLVVFGYTDTVR